MGQMALKYTILFDRTMIDYHIQEIKSRVREIKESYGKCKQLSNTINNTSYVPIPAGLELFVQKYFETPIENRETYIRNFNSKKQDRNREYLKVREKGLILASFENEVDKATGSINLLIQQCRELQKILPSVLSATKVHLRALNIIQFLGYKNEDLNINPSN